MEMTAWSVLPPIITIVLALVTKEVYFSLIIGIFSGAMLFTGGNFFQSIMTFFEIMANKVGDNVNILAFLVILGILVAAITRSGATRAYGEWARQVISGKKSALGLTAFLGILIFIDDYFNCLTVGTVMRPVTDKFKIARAKLAYIIDSTAAPICIIAPVSSWAAAVSSSLPEDSLIDGFALFLQTIPFNLYALLTMTFMAFIIVSERDFSTMRKTVEENKKEFKIPDEYKDAARTELEINGNGKIIDLVLPLLVLIFVCVYGMLYTGGIHEGKSVADAFADCDASQALVFGSFIALIFISVLYLPRKIITFSDYCECYSQGFKAMVPAIFILCLAWTLSGVCSGDYLNLGGYVGEIVQSNTSLVMFLPVVFFLVSICLAFATGTSWGTFGILIPISISILISLPVEEAANLLVICVAAILSGSVGGDHASPISDTTILASAGAQCNHLEHVSTQVPYVITVSACCVVGFLVDGFTQNGWLGLIVSFACLGGVMMFLKMKVAPPDEN
ncbi:MAG: Na+/H+ antiporter NhaC family protein [Selenomonadaceae bacterium]|nr:Na+/H+ antiporter NhaC family protein [Selenomonadaceae bacterium]